MTWIVPPSWYFNPKFWRAIGLPKPIDTFNKFMVGAGGRNIVFLRPIPLMINADEAMLLAAYLVSIAQIDATHTFEEVLKAVQDA